METLERALASMRDAAKEAGVTVACGDTKVVERGKGDGIFITTAGVGVSVDGWRPAPSEIRPGDRILLTGTMGDHQVAVLIARQELSRSTPPCCPTWRPLSGLLLPLLPRFAGKVRFMRDPTRGGVGVTLNEMASAANARFVLDEARLPVRESVRGVCEILGFDPLYLANEGKAVLIVAGDAAEAIVAALREHPYGREAAIIGEVQEGAKRRADAHPRGRRARGRLPRGGPAPADLLMGAAPVALIYDADCPVCRAAADWVRRNAAAPDAFEYPPLPLRGNPFAVPRDRRGRMPPGDAPRPAGRDDPRRGTGAPRDPAPHAAVPAGRRPLPTPRRRDPVAVPLPRLRGPPPPDRRNVSSPIRPAGFRIRTGDTGRSWSRTGISGTYAVLARGNRKQRWPWR